MRVQNCPPLAPSSVTVTTAGTPTSASSGKGAPIRRQSSASSRPASVRRLSTMVPT